MNSIARKPRAGNTHGGRSLEEAGGFDAGFVLATSIATSTAECTRSEAELGRAEAMDVYVRGLAETTGSAAPHSDLAATMDRVLATPSLALISCSCQSNRHIATQTSSSGCGCWCRELFYIYTYMHTCRWSGLPHQGIRSKYAPTPPILYYTKTIRAVAVVTRWRRLAADTPRTGITWTNPTCTGEARTGRGVDIWRVGWGSCIVFFPHLVTSVTRPVTACLGAHYIFISQVFGVSTLYLHLHWRFTRMFPPSILVGS